MKLFSDIINSLIGSIGAILSAIISLLPSSPFTFNFTAVSPYMKIITWIIPVTSILSLLAIYLPAVIVYYGLRVLMRYIRMVE